MKHREIKILDASRMLNKIKFKIINTHKIFISMKTRFSRISKR